MSPRMVILPPAYLPPAAYYAAMAAADVAVIDINMRHDRRRKDVHRTVIASTRGPLTLTVPVSHAAAPTWADVTVSDHGRWWEMHRASLATAYGRTPFYEYYAPMFNDLISEQAVGRPVTELATRLDALVRQLLGITTRVTAVKPIGLEPTSHSTLHTPLFYHQIRQDKLGFIPDMSIVDMLFNVGATEARQLLGVAKNE